MNAATKTKWATVITGLTGLVVVLQGIPLPIPPFTVENAKMIGGVLTLLSILFAYLKQHLSADVTIKGKNLTLLLIGLPAVLIGVADFIGLFTIPEPAAHWITFGISGLLMLVTTYSKLFFPTDFQKDKNEELKTIDPVKTQ